MLHFVFCPFYLGVFFLSVYSFIDFLNFLFESAFIPLDYLTAYRIKERYKDVYSY